MNHIIDEKECIAFLARVSPDHIGEEKPISWEFADDIFSTLDFDFSNPNSKILIPSFGFGTIVYRVYLELKKYHSHNHIVNNMLYGTEERPYRYTLVKNTKIPSPNFELCNFLKPSAVDEIKYDLILINPPITDRKDAKYFEKGFSLLNTNGTMVCLHLASPILTKKHLYSSVDLGRGSAQYIINVINKNSALLRLIDGRKNLSKSLDKTPISISYIKKDGIESNIQVRYEYLTKDESFIKVKSTNDIWFHGNEKITKSIIDKVLSKTHSSLDEYLYDVKYGTGVSLGWYLKCKKMTSDYASLYAKPASGFYCLITKESLKNKSKLIFNRNEVQKEANGQFITFSSKKEAENCRNFLICKFGRFLVSLFKINGNMHRGELKVVPYLDFSKKWDSADLYKYFNLSNEEIKFVESYIGDWYDFEIKNNK